MLSEYKKVIDSIRAKLTAEEMHLLELHEREEQILRLIAVLLGVAAGALLAGLSI